ncbi:hypothetical protein MDA_GLEAN10000920 [Myotis davidii]|uniref:Uncharacterized protein n=1 Tax=Myotis davidii TaxID=225400 RepID=L5MHW1_MYODS|nr:hypothetical protein MDA_GLEAN10000920 [Myotis davidii]
MSTAASSGAAAGGCGHTRWRPPKRLFSVGGAVSARAPAALLVPVLQPGSATEAANQTLFLSLGLSLGQIHSPICSQCWVAAPEAAAVSAGSQ